MVQNADLILTKNQIIKKVRMLLEQLQEDYINYVKTRRDDLPEAVIIPTPKISRGENYQGLPYLILDYPRHFNKETATAKDANTFAIRTMFWWGNFFSITLHLSGTYKWRSEKNIIAAYSKLKKGDYYININKDEWEHHFKKTNYVKTGRLTGLEFEKVVKENLFLKIAYKVPLKDWDNAAELLLHHFKSLVAVAH